MFWKTNILKLTFRTCAYHGGKNVSFLENFAHVLVAKCLDYLFILVYRLQDFLGIVFNVYIYTQTRYKNAIK